MTLERRKHLRYFLDCLLHGAWQVAYVLPTKRHLYCAQPRGWVELSCAPIEDTFYRSVLPAADGQRRVRRSANLPDGPLNKGVVGKGDRVSPASTGVFEVTAHLNEETHGKEAGKIVKSKLVPWVLKATLTTALSSETLDTTGEIKLTR